MSGRRERTTIRVFGFDLTGKVHCQEIDFSEIQNGDFFVLVDDDGSVEEGNIINYAFGDAIGNGVLCVEVLRLEGQSTAVGYLSVAAGSGEIGLILEIEGRPDDKDQPLRVMLPALREDGSPLLEDDIVEQANRHIQFPEKLAV